MGGSSEQAAKTEAAGFGTLRSILLEGHKHQENPIWLKSDIYLLYRMGYSDISQIASKRDFDPIFSLTCGMNSETYST